MVCLWWFVQTPSKHRWLMGLYWFEVLDSTAHYQSIELWSLNSRHVLCFHVITVLEESDHLPTSWRHTLLPRPMLQRCGSRKPSVPDYGIPIHRDRFYNICGSLIISVERVCANRCSESGHLLSAYGIHAVVQHYWEHPTIRPPHWVWRCKQKNRLGNDYMLRFLSFSKLLVSIDIWLLISISCIKSVGKEKIKTTCWENRAVGWVCIIDQSLDVWMCRCMAFKSDKNVNNPRDSTPTNRNTSNIILWQRMAPTIYGQHELIIWFSFANLMFSFISRL